MPHAITTDRIIIMAAGIIMEGCIVMGTISITGSDLEAVTIMTADTATTMGTVIDQESAITAIIEAIKNLNSTARCNTKSTNTKKR